MGRQQNFNKKQFFQKSIQRAELVSKKRKDIKSIKYGNFVEPDPAGVVETEDHIEQDLEVVDE